MDKHHYPIVDMYAIAKHRTRNLLPLIQPMSDVIGLSWVEVLSRGLSKKAINAQSQRAKGDAFKLLPEVFYMNMKI